MSANCEFNVNKCVMQQAYGAGLALDPILKAAEAVSLQAG
jgi:hypothetical protein